MKRIKALGLLAASMLLLTGCIDSMPDLTDEQTEMISEYSARLLLKYSSTYNYRLADDRVLADAVLQESLMEESQEESSETLDTENAEGESATDTQSTEESQEQSETQTDESEQAGVEVLTTDEADIAQLRGIDGVAIKYQSFEICDAYPKDSTGFSVTAAQGKKLLIVHFDIESATNESAECDIFNHNLSIRMSVNDKSVKARNTLLPDDISSYIDTIPAGEVREVVAVAEIDDMTDADIETFTMRISSSDGSFDIQLR